MDSETNRENGPELLLQDIANDLFILNQATIERLFKCDDSASCLALYQFYYKTAKWQKTNNIYATDHYVKKCLKWGATRLRTTKKTLSEMGLIEVTQKRKEGRIVGWFIKVSYIVPSKDRSTPSARNIAEIQEHSKTTSCSGQTNAYKLVDKCLKTCSILPLGLDAHNGSTLDKGTSKTPLSKEGSIANQNRRRIEKIKSYMEERLSQLSDKKIIPAIRKLTPIRVELMKDRIKEEPSMGYWRTLFDKIEEDADIYSKSSWFNFEFLFRKESKQKGSARDRILDGYYDFLRESDNSAVEDKIMYPEGSLEQEIYEDLSSMVSDNLSKSLEKQHLLADVIDRISLLRRPEEKSENGIARGYIDYRTAFCVSWDKAYQQEIRRYAEKHNMPICVQLISLESECWKSFEKEIKQRFTLVTHSDELSILQDEFDEAEAEAE